MTSGPRYYLPLSSMTPLDMVPTEWVTTNGPFGTLGRILFTYFSSSRVLPPTPPRCPLASGPPSRSSVSGWFVDERSSKLIDDRYYVQVRYFTFPGTGSRRVTKGKMVSTSPSIRNLRCEESVGSGPESLFQSSSPTNGSW